VGAAIADGKYAGDTGLVKKTFDAMAGMAGSKP